MTFDANGGNVEPESKEVMVGEAYGELPIPAMEGLIFDGWYTEAEEGELVTDETIVDKYEPHTLYAHWTSESEDSDDSSATPLDDTTQNPLIPDDPSETPTTSAESGETPPAPAPISEVTGISQTPAVNTVITEVTSGANYKVSSNDPNALTVTYIGSTNKKAKTITVPDKVTIDGTTYMVTKIDTAAFKGNTNVTKIVIGKNIASIGKNTFKNCKKLKTIVIKSSKFTTKTVAKGAFKGITKKTVIKVPKKKLQAYKKLFRKKGLSKKVKIKKG